MVFVSYWGRYSLNDRGKGKYQSFYKAGQRKHLRNMNSHTLVWTCTHTQTYTNTRTHGHTHKHTDSRTHTHKHTDTHGHTHKHTNTHKLMHGGGGILITALSYTDVEISQLLNTYYPLPRLGKDTCEHQEFLTDSQQIYNSSFTKTLAATGIVAW